MSSVRCSEPLTGGGPLLTPGACRLPYKGEYMPYDAIRVDITGEAYHYFCANHVFWREDKRPEYTYTDDFTEGERCAYCNGYMLEEPEFLEDLEC